MINVVQDIVGNPQVSSKIVSIVQFKKIIKDRVFSVIQCSGCFDFLHMGHMIYLQEASRLIPGSLLVVTVNANKRVEELKGRLINTIEERCWMLACLACVDYVMAFDEDTSEETIREIQPNIYVKGCDYITKPMPEAIAVYECGGTIHCIPESKTYNCTTTSMIERIRA